MPSSSTSLSFSASALNMWGSGSAFFFEGTWDLLFQLDETFEIASNGFEGLAKIFANIGFTADYYVNSGSVDIDYDINVTVTFDDNIQEGSTFTLSTSNNGVSNLSLTSESPVVKFDLDFIVDIEAGL